MTTKHTPGPWVVRASVIGTVVGPDRANGAVATLGAKPNPSDATLVAAAPDLLECLIDAARYICEHACNQASGEHSVACIARTAAIAKARGGA
jgi:hypothetical protein